MKMNFCENIQEKNYKCVLHIKDFLICQMELEELKQMIHDKRFLVHYRWL